MLTKYFQEESYCWEVQKIGHFFELHFRVQPRFGAFMPFRHLEPMLHNFNLLSLSHENFKCLSLPILIWTKWPIKNIKIGYFLNRKWRIKIWLDNFLPWLITTNVKNLMKICPRVWEKISRIKNNNKEKETIRSSVGNGRPE